MYPSGSRRPGSPGRHARLRRNTRTPCIPPHQKLGPPPCHSPKNSRAHPRIFNLLFAASPQAASSSENHPSQSARLLASELHHWRRALCFAKRSAADSQDGRNPYLDAHLTSASDAGSVRTERRSPWHSRARTVSLLLTPDSLVFLQLAWPSPAPPLHHPHAPAARAQSCQVSMRISKRPDPAAIDSRPRAIASAICLLRHHADFPHSSRSSISAGSQRSPRQVCCFLAQTRSLTRAALSSAFANPRLSPCLLRSSPRPLAADRVPASSASTPASVTRMIPAAQAAAPQIAFLSASAASGKRASCFRVLPKIAHASPLSGHQRDSLLQLDNHRIVQLAHLHQQNPQRIRWILQRWIHLAGAAVISLIASSYRSSI